MKVDMLAYAFLARHPSKYDALADIKAQATTFLKERLGQKVFASDVSIVEDPLRPNGLRSRAFDAEGIRAERHRLVDRGVLTTWLLDCASARQLGLSTTGNAVRDVSSMPAPRL